MEKFKADESLDTSGKCCPMPMVELNKAMRSMEAGRVLELVATDVATRRDIPSWCERTGNTLISSTEGDGVLRYFVRKAG